MNPLVSVIIPVYNSKNTIEKTLDSVINQTYQKIEVILIDDGSTDGSTEIMRKYIEKHKTVIFKIISKKNGGVSSARNRGIDESTGDYISFLDSDDIWLPKKIEHQVNIFLNNPKIDCLGTNMNGEKFKKMFGVKFDNLTRITPKMVLLKNFLCIQTTMIKKNVIKDIGYFYENQFNEDSNIIIRIANKYNCYLLNESYVIYIPNASGVSSRMWKMEKGELQNIKMALKMKVIKPIEFPFFVGFSLAKFCRRVIVNSFKKTCKK